MTPKRIVADSPDYVATHTKLPSYRNRSWPWILIQDGKNGANGRFRQLRHAVTLSSREPLGTISTTLLVNLRHDLSRLFGMARKGNGQSGIERMPYIFFSTDPFQIVFMVIATLSIFVVYLGFIFRRGSVKRSANQAMDAPGKRLFIVFAKLHQLISLAGNRLENQASNGPACPLNSLNPSVTRDFIDPLPSNYGTPFFSGKIGRWGKLLSSHLASLTGNLVGLHGFHSVAALSNSTAGARV